MAKVHHRLLLHQPHRSAQRHLSSRRHHPRREGEDLRVHLVKGGSPVRLRQGPSGAQAHRWDPRLRRQLALLRQPGADSMKHL